MRIITGLKPKLESQNTNWTPLFSLIDTHVINLSQEARMETEPSAKTKVDHLPQLRRSPRGHHFAQKRVRSAQTPDQISVVRRTNRPSSQTPHNQPRSCPIVPDRRGWGRHDSSREHWDRRRPAGLVSNIGLSFSPIPPSSPRREPL